MIIIGADSEIWNIYKSCSFKGIRFWHQTIIINPFLVHSQPIKTHHSSERPRKLLQWNTAQHRPVTVATPQVTTQDSPTTMPDRPTITHSQDMAGQERTGVDGVTWRSWTPYLMIWAMRDTETMWTSRLRIVKEMVSLKVKFSSGYARKSEGSSGRAPRRLDRGGTR